jgi:hypothetical protein
MVAYYTGQKSPIKITELNLICVNTGSIIAPTWKVRKADMLVLLKAGSWNM